MRKLNGRKGVFLFPFVLIGTRRVTYFFFRFFTSTFLRINITSIINNPSMPKYFTMVKKCPLLNYSFWKLPSLSLTFANKQQFPRNAFGNMVADQNFNRNKSSAVVNWCRHRVSRIMHEHTLQAIWLRVKKLLEMYVTLFALTYLLSDSTRSFLGLVDIGCKKVGIFSRLKS